MLAENLNIEEYRKKAEQGQRLYQYELGLCYWEGYKVEQDYKKAMDLFNAATKQKSVLPYYLMGLAYFSGLGVKANFKKSYECFLQAAKTFAHSDAYLKLGKACQLGLGVKQDYSKVKYWYDKCVDVEYSPAYLELGLLYQDINYPFHNIKTSFEWMIKAAESDITEAQIRVALKYKNGEGVDKDINQAIKWLKIASKKGTTHARYLFYKISGYQVNEIIEESEFMINKSIQPIIDDFKKHN